MPARACGTIRIPVAATMNKNTARTISAISPASIYGLLFGHERCRAPDLEHLHARARLEHLVLVVRACRRDLAVQPHRALVLRHPLEHRRVAPDERRGTRA